ncbi:MAG: lysophospholipid acyltransferase family protein [Spartobacteria bacterium]|nr:lysophospholipid acyltransferase family protein [Spartobacteria bacterium]
MPVYELEEKTEKKIVFSSEHLLRGPLKALSRPVDGLLDFTGVNQIYQRSLADRRAIPFYDKVLDTMGVTCDITDRDRERIPMEGPVFVVANHCFGALEGVMLCALLHETREDVKLLANYLLSRVPEMSCHFILVDPFGGQDAVRRNLRPMKEALRWLRAGGMLGTFPSGEVAHYDVRSKALVEPPWNDNIAGLIRRGRADVLPVFFEGSNSWYFHVAGMIHPTLRTALLPRQLTNKRQRRIRVHVGNPIPYEKLERLDDMMGYLRMRTYNLAHRRTEETPRACISVPERPGALRAESRMDPLVDPVSPDAMQRDMTALPRAQCLAAKGDLEVWFARAPQIPRILREIGRLREETFREVGEGTGLPIDLDAYDDYYLHLFLWNTTACEPAAAYRLGPTDEILPRHGRKGLYTHSLFRYGDKLLRQIGPALEMGRTFVRKSYQRNFHSMHLLWRGIAAYVLLNPRYRMLFGPVSINGNYQSSSQQLLVSFLKANNFDKELARLVKARMPLEKTCMPRRYGHDYPCVVNSLSEVEALIADIETELKDIPILLKQYLRLGGKLLGFNVDPAFSYVLDGLILVDLTKTDHKALQHYMGRENMKAFLDFHSPPTGTA